MLTFSHKIIQHRYCSKEKSLYVDINLFQRSINEKMYVSYVWRIKILLEISLFVFIMFMAQFLSVTFILILTPVTLQLFKPDNFLIQNDNICIKNNIAGRKYVQTATFTIFVMSSIFEKNSWQEADIKCVHSNIDWLIYNTYPPDKIGVYSSLLMD